MESISALQKERYKYLPKLPKVINTDLNKIKLELGKPTESLADKEALAAMFKNNYGKPVALFAAGTNKDFDKKLNVGVILSGGQAPGGHNVIAGLFDGLKKGNPESKLFGFLGGPSGIVENKAIEITKDIIDVYRNTGGFDIIGSGRTKLETTEQFDKAIEVCKTRSIKAVVIIGGDDSNTNAALLAEYFEETKCGIQVIGVPKTIDGDLKNEHIETSFGFDTATKTYSELIGNICRDSNSAKKYWHFIKLMGRAASHIGLECALQTQPNITIISEEIEALKKTTNQIVDDIVKTIIARADNGENFGIALIPEGLIEFIPEIKTLISELNNILAKHAAFFDTLKSFEDRAEWINRNLSKDSSYAFSSLPANIQKQLLMDRDPHGNVQVSRIDTEQLLLELVEEKLKQLKTEGRFKGKFSSQHHFFGYEGRCAFPSNFDSDYCYSLGYTAFLLILSGLTGYMSSIKNLSKPSAEWLAGGVPLTMMMNMEERHGKQKPVIKKALVELDGKPFKTFVKYRDKWAVKTCFLYPGAIQYYGSDSICNQPTKTLMLEHS